MPGLYVGSLWCLQATEIILWCFPKWFRNLLGSCNLNGEERPVAYVSHFLSQAEQNYAQTEREALAIVFAVQRFHQYLYGRDFTLVTDHHPLCKILGENEGIPPLAVRMQRWALLLSACHYKIPTHSWYTKYSCWLHVMATKFVREEW